MNLLNTKRLGPKVIENQSAPDIKFITMDLCLDEKIDVSIKMASMDESDYAEVIFKFTNEVFRLAAFRFPNESLKDIPKFIAKKVFQNSSDFISVKSKNLYIYPISKSITVQKCNQNVLNEFLRDLCLAICNFKKELIQIQNNYKSDPQAWILANCPEKKYTLNYIWNLQCNSTFLQIDKEEFEHRTGTEVPPFTPFTIVLIPEPDSNFTLRLLVPRENDIIDYYSYKVNYNLNFAYILQEFLNMILTKKFITDEDHYFQKQQTTKHFYLLINS